ncbi:unnamed protein product [Lasius platythorax]|uniref:Uncharacterized protein n=1 Tax=Lasius platythorax TaxID=488582 RepID=A0AAV2MVV1_9HYME
MCPRSFRNYIIPPREEEEEELLDPAVLCTKTTAFIHIENRAALCVVCFGNLPFVDKLSWCIRLKHTLTVGYTIDQIACSSCNRTITLVDNIHNCLTCQREYLIYNANIGNYTTDTDGRVTITIRDDTYQSPESIPEFL